MKTQKKKHGWGDAEPSESVEVSFVGSTLCHGLLLTDLLYKKASAPPGRSGRKRKPLENADWVYCPMTCLYSASAAAMVSSTLVSLPWK